MLTFLPTPIGNLADITLRSLEVLANADVVMCEDVRVSKKLIKLLGKNPIAQQYFHGIFNQKQFISFHSHNQEDFLNSIEVDFFHEHHIAFMSDAGMPCVSDPGAILVAYALKNGIDYDVLPGCSAGVNAYCFCGFVSDGFLFAGFLPHKQKDRQQRIDNFLQTIGSFEQNISIVVYESPHRILESLEDIVLLAPEIKLFAIKEMTKIHQKFFVGKSSEVLSQIRQSNTNGEWVLVLEGGKTKEATLSSNQILQMDLPPKIKAKLLSKLQNTDAKTIYEKICHGEYL
ncbi:16S rRNA (cytidine(1402)-2'-O)-methyltransferase [Helicobacter sp. 11S03491-1]|uniref:16S rRNA (cytidine(1402)-2'-O)-methyltransferase n=1 Tax=Helicobacter sp. 11S03491-1 TaxID=1476196 RepID=UPI000BA6E67E|nr:16S rRNA (cytidine(1402)-2'-O)-methyltransferase [Helicobacter sp. 11S03491-1]PAF42605.1 16S rRNA (cytidine(1402)-2'-O)-methyltransferase [Helicobacter sp. 11S03491-1]